jgi:hypothetical protein
MKHFGACPRIAPGDLVLNTNTRAMPEARFEPVSLLLYRPDVTVWARQEVPTDD